MRLRSVFALTLLTLAACGQTGDLYIPDARPAAEPVAAPETPTQDEEDDEHTPAG